MTKQPYMMLAGQNQGSSYGQNSVKFSAAIPPSSMPMSSLQGPAQIARGKAVMMAAAMPMDGENADFMKGMQDLKQNTLSVLQDKVE